MIELGDDQKKAFDMVTDFIKNGTSPACLYFGSAGTGKTLVANNIINWCEQNNVEYALCAPTHKAALVLSKYTDRPTVTLHKLLSLSPDLNIFELDFNNLIFKVGKGISNTMPYKGVVICDECSMINNDLYKVLLKKCSEFKNKMVMVGDFCQLQPVKQDYISEVIHIKPQVELKKIYRQSNENGLIPTLQALRTHSITRFEESIGKEGSLKITNNMKEFLDVAKEQVKQAIFNSDILSTKVLCYTNDRVRAYNKAIHQSLFGKECIYHKGEFLIGCENIEFNNFKFYNSMDYIIVNDPEKININIPNVGIFPGWKLELYDSLTKSSENISIVSEDISKDYIDLLSYTIENIRQKAINAPKQKRSFWWRKYFEIQGSFTIPFDLYFDGRLIRKKSFDYSYAITTHRSQGSSYNNILVDIKNINSCHDEAIKRQLQYVALSRTRNNALIYQ